MSLHAPDVIVNVDLLFSTSYYLERLDLCRSLLETFAASTSASDVEQRIRQSIHRYEHLWLPLVSEWRPPATSAPSSRPNVVGDDPEPPVDIGVIWHIHMLKTGDYIEFCLQHYGRILPHRIRAARGSDIAQITEATAGIWRQRYPADPFNVVVGEPISSSGTAPTDPRLTELILGAVRREVDFLYQMSLPHMRDQNFLYAAVERYRKWLLLRRQRPADAVQLRLPVDIRLIARVHALHPVQYVADMTRIFQQPQQQSAVVSNLFRDLSAELISTDFDVTPAMIEKSNLIWRTTFRGERLFVAGTGCRGRLSAAVVGLGSSPLVEFPHDKLITTSGRRTLESCDVSFTSVTIDELWSQSKRVIVEARLLGENSFAQSVVFRVSGPVGTSISGSSTAGNGTGQTAALGATHFDAHKNRGIELVIYGRQGFACFARDRKLASRTFNPLQTSPTSGSPIIGGLNTVTLQKVTYTDPKITICYIIEGVSQKPNVFTLERSSPALGPVTTDLRQLVATLPSWSTVMMSADSLFVKARHGLKCRDGTLNFGVEVLRHERTNMAAVLLYLNNKDLVAAAYSLDEDQLPDPSQVSETCPLTYDVQDGDHAMLLRNRRGDFCVCVARWHSVTETTAGDSCEGKVVFQLYFIGSRQTVHFEIRDDEMQSFKVTSSDGSFEVDLPTGRMTMDASIVPLPEYLTLAFAVGVMYVTIHKKYSSGQQQEDWPTGSVRSALSVADVGRSSPVPSESSHKSAGNRLTSKFSPAGISQKKRTAKRRKMSASFTFLLACGFHVDASLLGIGSTIPGVHAGGSTRLSPEQARHMNGTGSPAINGGFTDIKL